MASKKKTLTLSTLTSCKITKRPPNQINHPVAPRAPPPAVERVRDRSTPRPRQSFSPHHGTARGDSSRPVPWAGGAQTTRNGKECRAVSTCRTPFRGRRQWNLSQLSPPRPPFPSPVIKEQGGARPLDAASRAASGATDICPPAAGQDSSSCFWPLCLYDSRTTSKRQTSSFLL